ncbi:unnamed protein product, partial [Rotaria magnacalcarata]
HSRTTYSTINAVVEQLVQ